MVLVGNKQVVCWTEMWHYWNHWTDLVEERLREDSDSVKPAETWSVDVSSMFNRDILDRALSSWVFLELRFLGLLPQEQGPV